MTLELEGQVAFITGAAHGQGRATALALARAADAGERTKDCFDHLGRACGDDHL